MLCHGCGRTAPGSRQARQPCRHDAAPNRVDGPVLKFANLVTCPAELQAGHDVDRARPGPGPDRRDRIVAEALASRPHVDQAEAIDRAEWSNA
jgi:hypothetical protein